MNRQNRTVGFTGKVGKSLMPFTVFDTGRADAGHFSGGKYNHRSFFHQALVHLMQCLPVTLLSDDIHREQQGAQWFKLP